MFASEMDTSRSWNQHHFYLIALCQERESHERLVVENIVKYAAPHLKIAMMVRYQPSRMHYLTHEQELIAWAQEIEDDGKVIKMMKGIVSAVVHRKIQGHYQGDDRKCFNYSKRGHLSRRCYQSRKDDGRWKANFVLAACKNLEPSERRSHHLATFLTSLKEI
uniref:RxLR effector candidate protein n=1 Tax=Hyaloperonospora arabidopsidis (strain Emoy2) TaxID=559515 RepID=M4BE92_HYAAE